MSKVSAHRRTYGQFFTPESVVACCYALAAQFLPSAPWIVDPACGDGAFLRYALDQTLTSHNHVHGCDLDSALVAGLHQAGVTQLLHADGLEASSLPTGAFDLVVGNPPFGVATSGGGQAAYPSEARFLIRALELVRPGGVVVMVLPSGVLANERLRSLRDDVLARCTVLAVIALPRTTFRQAGTSAACSILALRNTAAPPGHSVCFGLPARLGNLEDIVAAYRAGAASPSQASIPSDAVHSSSTTPTSSHFWLAQAELISRRMDAQFWHPSYRALDARMSSRYQLLPLSTLIDRRRELIAGDHVRPSRGEAKGPGLPYEYYQTREFLAAGYNYSQLERCNERAYRRLRHTAVQQHDVLVSCAGVGGAGQGRVCLVTHQPGPSCTGDVLIVRPRQIDPIFLFLFLSSRPGRQQLRRLQNGVSTANLSVDELMQVEMPVLAPVAQSQLSQAFSPIADAHHAAMAALQRHDRAAFMAEYSGVTALLGDLLAQLDMLLLGAEP